MIALPPVCPGILATRTLLPPLRHTADEVERAFMEWLSGQDRDLRLRAQRILRNAGVDGRHSFPAASRNLLAALA
jgi:hypothetical protein